MITNVMRDFGVFDGDISTMCARPIKTAPLYVHKPGSLSSYFRAIYLDIVGGRKARGDERYLPRFENWLGAVGRDLIQAHMAYKPLRID